ncbi:MULTISPECIES: hypothetical protein [unclassified Nocardioides]|uniref:hypothetical protein n=1 Tax=unclassified Nocardioides TaxID=2615069 RepID=UPI0006F49EEB|nr:MULTISPECIES: hypothetical protein [unclassified Nocardioides]KRA37911.1 hypothetical protein ASD81_04295 [Nocardioides sp. Root614]KRA91871.1 hypothetical protein ASD84_04560 [Nocardioides sp. Root682]
MDDLLGVVDVDELGDIETFLMFLLERPVRVESAWDDEGIESALDVHVRGDEWSMSSAYDFPLSLIELARSCAETAVELGPFTGSGASPSTEPCDLVAMSDADLIAEMQGALGKVRIFNLMEDDA